MEKEVDVITLCKRVTELTKQEKCIWKETSEKNRFRLNLKNGSIEIHHFKPTDIDFVNAEYYDVSMFDNNGDRYATYRAEQTDSDSFKTFEYLYKEVRKLLEKFRRRKMALLFEELDITDDNK